MPEICYFAEVCYFSHLILQLFATYATFLSFDELILNIDIFSTHLNSPQKQRPLPHAPSSYSVISLRKDKQLGIGILFIDCFI